MEYFFKQSGILQEGVVSAIALGSNLGDSLIILEAAIQTLIETPAIKLLAKSSWYKTKPIGPPQPDYLNGCILLQVDIVADLLLEILLKIENKFGRIRKQKWGARTLDLDILLYGNQVINTPRLQIPHPRMCDRAFVLVPLAEIAPDWVEPVSGFAIKELVKDVDCSEVCLFKGN
jgi:2-amino-4-hydroxy-6-hydroxymethyldihydropteridine diphosphokinase